MTNIPGIVLTTSLAMLLMSPMKEKPSHMLPHPSLHTLHPPLLRRNCRSYLAHSRACFVIACYYQLVFAILSEQIYSVFQIQLFRYNGSDTTVQIQLFRYNGSDITGQIQLFRYNCSDTIVQIQLFRYNCSDTTVQIQLFRYNWSDTTVLIRQDLHCICNMYGHFHQKHNFSVQLKKIRILKLSLKHIILLVRETYSREPGNRVPTKFIGSGEIFEGFPQFRRLIEQA